MRNIERHRNSERGAGRLKAMVWLGILASAFYVGVKVVPVLLNGYQFQDAMQTTARLATVTRKSPEDIRKSLLEEAQKNDIPVTPEDIRVTSQGGNVRINAEYSVTVDLNVYQWTLHFHPTASNNALF